MHSLHTHEMRVVRSWGMPKPVKKTTKKSTTRKRPSSDPNTRAGQMMAEHMAKLEQGKFAEPAPATDVQAIISAHMKALGAKGGKISGAKRMEMPEKQRKAIAKKAAAARWGRKGH
jgi:hypothetical protein